MWASSNRRQWGVMSQRVPLPLGRMQGPSNSSSSFPSSFADFQPLVGQGLPELGASLFSSPQGGMFMEEKPKPPRGPV